MDDPLTVRVAAELIGYEAIVLESYLDSVNVWTWGIGVTDSSGHSIERYKDRPSSVEEALQVFAWLLRTHYIPAVLQAFSAITLTETQFAAALSFHYNTGAIGKTEWVQDVIAGHPTAARAFLENHYLNGGALKTRRLGEAALFFDGKWANDGKATICPVSKPSYHPNFHFSSRVDISAALAAALSDKTGAP